MPRSAGAPRWCGCPVTSSPGTRAVSSCCIILRNSPNAPRRSCTGESEQEMVAVGGCCWLLQLLLLLLLQLLLLVLVVVLLLFLSLQLLLGALAAAAAAAAAVSAVMLRLELNFFLKISSESLELVSFFVQSFRSLCLLSLIETNGSGFHKHTSPQPCVAFLTRRCDVVQIQVNDIQLTSNVSLRQTKNLKIVLSCRDFF